MATLFEAAMGGYNAADEMISKGIAKRAAVEKYGDMAHDPGLYSALQGIELAEKRDNRSAEMQTYNIESRSRREARDVQTHNFDHQTKVDDKKKDGILNLVQGLRKARDDGEDLGVAFDNMVDILPGLGVDEKDIPEMRKQLVENPDMLDEYYAALMDGKGGAKTAAAAQKKADAEAAAAEGQQKVSSTIGGMRKDIARLDELGGITSLDAGPLGNMWRWHSGSWTGRFIGRLVGGEEEKLRQAFEGKRMHLVNAVKSAEGLGAKMFDSNKDMEMWLASMGDPASQNVKTVIDLLDEFETKYGLMLEGQPYSKIKMDPKRFRPDRGRGEQPTLQAKGRCSETNLHRLCRSDNRQLLFGR